MSYVVIDTDVASATRKGRLPAAVGSFLAGRTLRVAFVTIGELARWMHQLDLGPRRRRETDAWLGSMSVLRYSPQVARTWGVLTARARQRGRPRPVNDTWLAAASRPTCRSSR